MIKILTIEQEPCYRNGNCIVCNSNPTFRILQMGGHQTQMCEDCLKQLYLALGGVLTTGERTNDDDKE